MSGSSNSVRVSWTGKNLDFTGKFGSGFDFDMGGGETKKAGSPMEFLLAGLAGCTAVDVLNILEKRRKKVTGVDVEVVGQRAADYPMVYTDIEVTYIVRGEDVDAKSVERAIELSEEKYCSASITFKRAGTRIRSSYRIEPGA